VILLPKVDSKPIPKISRFSLLRAMRNRGSVNVHAALWKGSVRDEMTSLLEYVLVLDKDMVNCQWITDVQHGILSAQNNVIDLITSNRNRAVRTPNKP